MTEPSTRPARAPTVGVPHHVLVVGAGFLGSHVARGFVHRSVPTTVLARRPPTGTAEARLAGTELVLGDAADREAFVAALGDADHVVWCAGGSQPAEANARPIEDVMTTLPPLLSTLGVLASRPHTGMTFLSSGGTVYGDPTVLPVPEHHTLAPRSAYGVRNAAAEMYVGMHRDVHGFTATVLRCGNVYGPGQQPHRSQGVIATAIECARRSTPFPLFGDGTTVRDYVHVDDVVDVVCTLAGRPDPPAVVNVGTGVGTSTLALVDDVERATGRQLEIEPRPARAGDVRSIVLDVSLLHSLMAFDPVPVDIGIARLWGDQGDRGRIVGL